MVSGGWEDGGMENPGQAGREKESYSLMVHFTG